MKRLITSVLISVISAISSLSGYSYGIKDYNKDVQLLINCDTLYVGQGSGASEEDAYNMAMNALSNNIFCWVISETGTVMKNEVKNGSADTEISTNAKIHTYSQGFFSGLEPPMYCEDGDTYHCCCYVGKSQVEKENDKRKELIEKEIKSAIENKKQNNITGALNAAYSAQARLNCLSSDPSLVMIKNEYDIDEAAYLFIPDFIENILSGIRAEITGKTDIPNQYKVKFTYNDKPVNGIRYEYVCGNSNQKAQGDITTGESIIDLKEGYRGTSVKFKWIYKNPIEGTELGKMLKLSKVNYGKKNEFMAPLPQTSVLVPQNKVSIPKTVKIKSETFNSDGLMVADAKTKDYDLMISDVVKCIKSSRNIVAGNKANHYASIRKHFTTDGYDEFMKLIGYGTATLMDNDLNLQYLNINGYIYCRKLKINFKVDRYKSFTEDVVFILNDDKIDGVSFAISDGVAEYLSDESDWSDRVKNIVRNFLEDYRTAYALKDTVYLADIFSPEALIVIGRKITKLVTTDGLSKPHKNMETIQMSTKQYLQRLQRIFDNNAYINVGFSDYVVKRVFPNAEIYSVQVKQDYYSTHYGDTGYLTLCVDLTDTSKPIVHIRAWQEEKDPNWGWLNVYKVGRLINK